MFYVGLAFVKHCFGQGPEVKYQSPEMRTFSIFVMGSSYSRGVWGMSPQNILKIKYLRLAKVDFLHEKWDQIHELPPNFYFEELRFPYEGTYKFNFFFIKGHFCQREKEKGSPRSP